MHHIAEMKPGSPKRLHQGHLFFENKLWSCRPGTVDRSLEMRSKEEPASQLFLRLAAERSRWLAYLRSRGATNHDAEDLLQSSLVKAFQNVGSLRSEVDLIPWFYKVLRNSLYDHFRKAGVEGSKVEDQINEMEDTLSPALPNEMASVCYCFKGRLNTLNDRYAELIRKIDLDEESPATFAQRSGKSIGATHVALHRARQALREDLEKFCRECATDGACLDCGCGERSEIIPV